VTPAHDEAPGGNQGQTSSNSSTANPTVSLGHSPLFLVARVDRVVARSGKARFVWLYRCPARCEAGAMHSATTRELVDKLQRRTPCGSVVVTLLTPVVAEVAA
jgi:hypothetical protein